MKKYLKQIFSFIFLFLITSCNRTKPWGEVAGLNENELQKVLDIYTDSTSLKKKSARFLIDNIAGHHYYKGSAIDSYTNFVTHEKFLTSAIMHEKWDSLKKTDRSVKIYDVHTLSCNYICDNIENAIKVWEKTPWRGKISEEIFLKYVLPYRVKNEPPSCIGWRDSLYNRYHHLIDGVDDVRIAFGKVHKYLLNEFQIHDIGGFPYLLSAMDAGQMKTGRCINQSAYIVSVMRSLGIPASLDLIRNWANFSTNGHSWAALVTDDGTYTVMRNDSVARKFNEIDASVFHIKDTLGVDFPYKVNFKKRISKVWRYSYMYNTRFIPYDDSEADETTYDFFKSPFYLDVTSDYGYSKNIKIDSFLNFGYTYLCTFRTGSDWAPVAFSYSILGNLNFADMPDSVIYLPLCFERNKGIKVLGDPFVVTDKGIISFKADTVHLQTMIVNRKYPFSLLSAKSWPQIRGGRLEASNDRTFKKSETIFVFSSTPLFRNEISVKNKKKYRYVRYCSHRSRYAYIAEIEVFSKTTRQKGMAYGKGVCNPRVCFDGDSYSFLKPVCKGSWVALDFGKPIEFDKIVVFPKNDGNNVVVGKQYELYCFVDHKWRKIGMCKSNDYNLIFTNVPSGGIYRLHCVDGGNEEQIFSYKNGQQVWW